MRKDKKKTPLLPRGGTALPPLPPFVGPMPPIFGPITKDEWKRLQYIERVKAARELAAWYCSEKFFDVD